VKDVDIIPNKWCVWTIRNKLSEKRYLIAGYACVKCMTLLCPDCQDKIKLSESSDMWELTLHNKSVKTYKKCECKQCTKKRKKHCKHDIEKVCEIWSKRDEWFDEDDLVYVPSKPITLKSSSIAIVTLLNVFNIKKQVKQTHELFELWKQLER
jgi:hypothetical protein